MIDTRLPAGLVVRRMTLTYLGEPFDWWRVENGTAIVGSGFDRDEAICQARAELERRGHG